MFAMKSVASIIASWLCVMYSEALFYADSDKSKATIMKLLQSPWEAHVTKMQICMVLFLEIISQIDWRKAKKEKNMKKYMTNTGNLNSQGKFKLVN